MTIREKSVHASVVSLWQFADYLWCSLASDAVCLFLSSCSHGIFPACLSAPVSKPPLIIILLILQYSITYTKYTQWRPHLITTFNLLFNTIFPNKVIFWITGLGIQLIFMGDKNSIHNYLHRGQRRRSSSADSEVLSQTKAHPLHYVRIITFITSSLFWGGNPSKLHCSSFPRRGSD